MEVVQVWEYGMPPAVPIYSGSVGDADWMPETGNVLINYGNTTMVGGISGASLGMGANHARIVEVDHGTPAEVVFEMAVFDPATSLRIYRAERIPSLYPESVSQYSPTKVPVLGALRPALLFLLIAAMGTVSRWRAVARSDAPDGSSCSSGRKRRRNALL